MDDLVGTQAPRCRLADPAASVAELERALPGLVVHRRTTPAGVDWPRLEVELGMALPAGFTLLCEFYPAFDLSDFMLVGGPVPGGEAAWAQGAHEQLETIAEWCEDADLAAPMHPYPTPGGLLPWSTSNQGDFFVWTTSPAGPHAWTVTVASRTGG